MLKGGGKRKGNSFERKVAKLIVKTFSNQGIEQRECWRSVLSGGHEIACGDLYMSDRLAKLFPYALECKNYRKIKWVNFFLSPTNKNSREQKWLQQAREGAKKAQLAGLDLRPLLVIKENFGPIYVLSETELGLHFTTLRRLLKLCAKKPSV